MGDDNGKFMCGQYVLRGRSCAAPATRGRMTCRTVFPPEARSQFTCLRRARDPESALEHVSSYRQGTRLRSTLKRQQALKKRAVATQGNAEIFRGRLVPLIQLALKFDALIGKRFCQALHHLSDELVTLPHSLPGV